MSHLLEKQYKRGERARKKNKQEERKMVHEISGKNGLRALHEYRVEMVTREQRKVAEELERIRQGLQMYKGQRWNAGAKHKEAKRGLHAAAAAATGVRWDHLGVPSPPKPAGHHHQRGKPDAVSFRSPMNISSLSREVKSGPFLTDRRPMPKSGLAAPAPGTVSNPVSGRREKKSAALKLHAKESYQREDAVTSSKSMANAVLYGGGGSRSEEDSDDDDFSSDGEGVSRGGLRGPKRPPDPEILKAILKGVVQCWEETVVMADPSTSVGYGGSGGRRVSGDIQSEASISDLLSPRGQADRGSDILSGAGKADRNDSALSLALLRNMKANNVDSKKQSLDKRPSASIHRGPSDQKRKETFFLNFHREELPEDVLTGGGQIFSARSPKTYKRSRLSASLNPRDVSETVEEYVANISKDLIPTLKGIHNTSDPIDGDQKTSITNGDAPKPLVSHVTSLPHSARSSKGSKASEHAPDHAAKRSYGRHVRTTYRDSKKQDSRSQRGSAKSSKANSVVMEMAETMPIDQISAARSVEGLGQHDNADVDETDDIPHVSFRLPPLKKVPKSGSCKSARSSVSSFRGGHESALSDIQGHGNDSGTKTSSSSKNNHHTPLPRLPSATARNTAQSKSRRHEHLTPTTLPRLPLSASVSSTPRLQSQQSTHQEDRLHARARSSVPTSAGDVTQTLSNGHADGDLQVTRAKRGGGGGGGEGAGAGIRYKKKLHVYQRSPRGTTTQGPT